ncbi:TetR/AcrR family transcriptional regulator [Parachitinimonas caeni]|uniref:TetR/AcrR family transcriptional regulator n=1 Tax=Parachitinimonas caeni TaxID=3031301 RepID=A0ABT7DVT7_9NEIS|nr:TetR/AcrR family transcriptional regulator [Parachitinimonas caeni]MDK2124175.1 TetR/AcrR family transcriptional regulator [Parachitinimonas caeni]
MKTYDRIVQESLKLFNEHGERSITTNHIAAHLGISPGNLYYHFRNKEEIIYQIFCQYKTYIQQHLQLPEDRPLLMDDMIHYLDTAFVAMWQYRFMFYDLPGILSRNTRMQEEYTVFLRQDLANILSRLFTEFSHVGIIRVAPEDIEPLSVNTWLIVKFWFAFHQTANPTVPITEDTGRRGVLQVLSLLKPYVQPSFMPLYEELEAAFGRTITSA